MEIFLDGALSFLLGGLLLSELLEEGGGSGDEEKGEARFKEAMIN